VVGRNGIGFIANAEYYQNIAVPVGIYVYLFISWVLKFLAVSLIYLDSIYHCYHI